MVTTVEEVQSSLERHNTTFERLLNLIPAKYYLEREPEDEAIASSKYQKNSKKQKAPKQAIKEASKKAKRDKLDPANNKTILEIQHDRAAQNNAGVDEGRKSKGKRKAVENDADDSDSMELDEEVDVAEEAEATVQAQTLVPIPATGGANELREKLHARMAALRRGNRWGADAGDGEAGSKDELLEERRRQRAEMRERRRKETKEKIKQEKEARGKKEKERERGPSTK
ncbi:hypothetical protein NM688_g2990 [Phlebia brevispora]|uniref:Uncharacterized protein n=1 Tax=Phlebia brevispora TaxID=194682 RepID=A0ACC1T710_9APHY|nr:hypothetical protein NM688_g2990 [Phlebia brevispora]